MTWHPRKILMTIIFVLMLFSLIWALYPFLSNPTSITDAYQSAGALAPLVFIVLVAIAPTPGAIVGASGGGYFGLWEGTVLLYIGNVLAAIITFALVRYYGRPAAQKFLDPSKLAKADAFLNRHPGMLWVVYALPIFPLELMTSVVALSDRSFRKFIWIPLTALPIDAFLVTAVGNSLSREFSTFFEYASILIVLVLSYGLLHVVYNWKRNEIYAAGAMVGSQVKRGVGELGKQTEKVARNVHRGVQQTVDTTVVNPAKHIARSVRKKR